MKKIIAVLVLIFTIIISQTCYAAPGSVSAWDGGNITGLVIVKKPETAVSTTTKQIYTVSALNLEGVEVSIYKYNPYTGYFEILRDGYGNPVSNIVGATGIYVRDIALDANTNYLMVRAQYGGIYQNIRFDITLMDQGLLDSIQGFASNFGTKFGGW